MRRQAVHDFGYVASYPLNYSPDSTYSGKSISRPCRSFNSLLTSPLSITAVSPLIFSTYVMLNAPDTLQAYEHFANTYYQYLPHSGNCAGEEGAALFGCALLTSYLGLFINFYFQTYKKSKKLTGVAAGRVNGHANATVNTTT